MEEFAIAIGALIGAMVAAFGVTAYIGWRLWRGLKSVIKGTSAVADDMSEALGPRDDDDPCAPLGRERRKTGSFQTIVRDELDAHLAPLDRRFDRIESSLDGISTRQAELDQALKGQAELIADLSRSHGKVAKRTAEHSARLNVAEADESMARGKL